LRHEHRGRYTALTESNINCVISNGLRNLLYQVIFYTHLSSCKIRGLIYLMRSFSKGQLIIIVCMSVIPLCTFLFLFTINPCYEGHLLSADSIGILFLVAAIAWWIIGTLAIILGFRIINRSTFLRASNGFERTVSISILTIVMFIVATLPILAIVILAPAFVILVQAYN
jgi:hypothetical protein